MPDSVTVVVLQQMKRDGRKIAGIVAWDPPMAKIASQLPATSADGLSTATQVGIQRRLI